MDKESLMDTIMFDTHHYFKRLTAAGFTEEQAEVQAETIIGLIDDQLATKKDISQLQAEMRQIEERLTYKLTLRLGSMLVVAISIVTALVKIG
jgi:hypothetical protein